MRIPATIALLCLCSVVIGCAGTRNAPQSGSPAAQPASDQKDEPPRYVIVHRNTPIRLAPDDDAPFLQYRTPERQAKFDERRAEERTERQEKEKERAEERREREKKRAERRRRRRRKLSWKRRKELRERDAERAEERRRERAIDALRDQAKRANADRIEGPDRPWIPFRLVADDGEWLRLAPVVRGVEPPHCYLGNFGEVDRLDAEFWVRRDDLATVVDHRVRIPVGQGAEVILLPGVALEPLDEEDRYRVYVDGFVLELTIPADSVGTEYRPQLPFEAPLTDTTFNPVALAEGDLRLGDGQPLPFNPYRPLYVTGTLFVGHRFYATTQTPCGEYTVRADEEDIEAVGRRGATRLSGDTESVEPPFARPGAAVFLPSGERFGTVEVAFPLGDSTGTSEGRRCYRTAVWGSTDAAVSRGLELCFEPDDIEEATE